MFPQLISELEFGHQQVALMSLMRRHSKVAPLMIEKVERK